MVGLVAYQQEERIWPFVQPHPTLYQNPLTRFYRKQDTPTNTLSAALNQMGYQGLMTAHGFRATARTILVERLDFPSEWVEMQLGHRVRDANGRAYNRTTFIEQRRGMLQTWADYLDSLRNGTVLSEDER